MGIEKDYLMRQLMMLFEVIQKILRYRKKGEKGKALEQINTFYNYLKIEENLDEFSISELIDFLTIKKSVNNEQLEMIAFVLKEQGELEENQTKQIDFFRKAYFLLEKVERESTTFSMDRQMKIAELKTFVN